MTLLQLVQATKSYGSKLLFSEAGFSVNEGEHIGVIGPNGAGKSTLFKIIVGREAADHGDLIKTNGLRIGYLEQESDWTHLELTPEAYFNHRTDYCWPIWEVKQWGQRLGLNEELFKKPFKDFSGGFRMRFKLLDLISQDPHLMLLDEPTNFLDLETLLVLESFLREFKGAFLLISHDREFLQQVADHTLEVEGGGIQKFPGSIDDYFEAKAEWQIQEKKQAATLDAKRRHLESFVERFRAKATKAKQAQSRIKQLEKMERMEIKALPLRAQIPIPPPSHTGKEVIQLDQVNLGYQADFPLLKNINLSLRRGDHIGVVGINGAGKSTLLKSIAGALPPLAGSITLGFQVTLSYYAQHSADQLQANESVVEALSRAAHSSVTHQEILNMAGALLFSGDDIQKKIQVLSGGEKSRVALGQVLLQKNPLLVLDEPTNHLDFDTVEALTQALQEFQGALVVVSHDRSFIRRIASKIIEIRNGKVQFYPGTYDEYVWSLEKGVLAEMTQSLSSTPKNPSDGPSATATSPQQTKISYEDRKKAESDRRKLEKESLRIENKISLLTTQQAELNLKLSSATNETLATLSQDLTGISQEIIDLEERYFSILQELEKLSEHK